MNKWEVDEHKQWSEKVGSHYFFPQCWTKIETMKGSDKRKSFVEPVGMNGSNFENEMVFLSLTAIIITTNG